MEPRVQEIIIDLKSYFEYLKEMGIPGISIPGDKQRKDVLKPPFPQRSTALEDVRKELGDCRRCKLHRTRRNLVFGEGNKRARLMVIGEGPGHDEDMQGKPFVGRAGQLLT